MSEMKLTDIFAPEEVAALEANRGVPLPPSRHDQLAAELLQAVQKLTDAITERAQRETAAWVPVATAAHMLGRSRKWVIDEVKSGRLVGEKPQGTHKQAQWMIEVASVERHGRTVAPAAAPVRRRRRMGTRGIGEEVARRFSRAST